MVRRVGFGDDDPEKNRTSVADRALERHRTKARLKDEATDHNRRRMRRLVPTVIFTVLWVAVIISILLRLASDGLNANVMGILIVVAFGVFSISALIKDILKIIRGEKDRPDRPENF